MAGTYEYPEGFHIDRLYPAEGDSAIAELWFGGSIWAQIELEGNDIDEVGAARTRDATFKFLMFGPRPGSQPSWWVFDLGDVEDQLAQAKDWLIENEQGRLPIESNSESP